jgi:ribonuclease G
MSKELALTKEIYVNVGDRETRIAVMEDGRLVEMHIERSERVVGGLYKCRVANVLQGMDAAFVDIGLERNAFLYVGDILPGAEDLMITKPDPRSAPPPVVVTPAAAEPSREERNSRRSRFARGRRSRKGEDVGTPSSIPDEVGLASSALVGDAVPTEELGGASVGELADEFDTGTVDIVPVGEPSDLDMPQAADTGAMVETDVPDVEAFAESLPEEAFTSDMASGGLPLDPLAAFIAQTDALIAQAEQEVGTIDSPRQSASGETAEAEFASISSHTEEVINADGSVEEVEVMDDVVLEDEEPAQQSGLVAGEVVGVARRPPPIRRAVLKQQRIKDVLKLGQELLVQVIKGPRSTKGARVSTRISLPGRYLVLMPENDMLGVSRKIEDGKERDRLKRIGERLRIPGFGVIIRTEAEEKTEQELQADMDFLVEQWRVIQKTARDATAPALVQADLTLLYKTIRDVFGSDVSKLVIDDPAEYERANALIETLSPKLKGRIHLYDEETPIFDKYKIEDEFKKLTQRKVLMRSGGSLVIDETEALTVIDVNTSKFTGSSSLAETIVKTNLDAAGEVARQLRLRDIGGIIVIDFIDMNNARDKQAVIKALEMALKRDRSRTKISNISPLGLVEMTRKRTGETLTSFLTDECPYCKGRGHLPTAESMSVLIERDLRRQAVAASNAKREAFVVTCHPDVAELLIGPDGAAVSELERDIQKAVYVRADAEAHIERYTIAPGDMDALDKQMLNYRRAQVVECVVTKSLLKEGGKCIGWANGYLLDLDDGAKMTGQTAKARILDVRRSFAPAQIVPGTGRGQER